VKEESGQIKIIGKNYEPFDPIQPYILNQY